MIDFGINQVELSGGDQYVSEANSRLILEGIADVGASRVRIMAGWDFIETSRGNYEFTNLDRAVDLATEYGLKPLFVMNVGPNVAASLIGPQLAVLLGIPLANMPAWASPQTYGDFARALAMRYGPSGTGQVNEFELWNEQNNIGYFPQAKQPAVFAEYIKGAYRAIKPVHPGSTVITGGTMAMGTGWPGLDPLEFITGMYDAGVKDFCDAVGYHWYNNGPSFEDVPPSLTAPYWVRLEEIRALMVARGDTAKKIWVTEIGVAIPPLDPLVARDQLKTMVDQLGTLDYLGPWFIYNYRDSGSTHGLVDASFNKKQPLWDYVDSISGSDTADVTAPDPPDNLTAETITSTTVSLVWDDATDNVGVTGYKVYNYGLLVASVLTTYYTARDLTAGSLQEFTVTALDAAGNESAVSDTITPQTLAPSGSQSFFDYEFTSAVPAPTVFTEFGQGFSVDGSGKALHDNPSSDGVYYSGGYWNEDHLSANHWSQVRLSSDTQRADRSAGAVVRYDPSNGNFVGVLCNYGGAEPTADGAKIITSISGTVTVRSARNAVKLTSSDDLRLSVEGNTYIAYKINNGDIVELVQWIDSAEVFPGEGNRRSGFVFQHRRVGSANYAAPAITGRWRAQDLQSLEDGEMAMWMLAVAKEEDWSDLFGGAPWESVI